MRQITRSDDIEFLLYVIPALDGVVLKDYYDEAAKKAQKPPKGKSKK